MKVSKTLLVATVIATLPAAFPTAASANDLLSGTAELNDGTPVPFNLGGNSREDVIGGFILFGDRKFEITSVSEQNLVGAKLEDGDIVHKAVFSSSYSRVTSTGKPWVAGQAHHGCERPYNSFMAIYEVSMDALEKLPDPAYWQLAENATAAISSTVYCFMSQPSDWG